MFAMHGVRNPAGGDVDVFAFHLARELGKTVGEIENMAHAEYLAWSSYFTARHAIQSVRGPSV